MKKIIFLSLTLLCSLIIPSLKCDTSVDTCAKHDWIVTSNPSKSKSHNEFDVIVIGSGIGGLSCASILSTKGYKVLVLEQHNQVGGFCSSYTRDGFSCDTGAEDISGLHELGATTALLKMVGLNKENLFTLHSRTYLIDGKEIITTGKNDFIQQVAKYYPQEKQALKLFLDEGQKAFEEFIKNEKQSSQPCPTFSQWQSVTYQEKLDEFFTDVEIKNLLCALLCHVDIAADKIPASIALLACLQYFIYGGYYPKGGPQHFANNLKEVIEKHGGTVLTSCRVDQILASNNQVSGIKAGNQIFLSPIVISNANAKTTFLELVPQGTIDQAFVDAIDKLKMSCSVIQLTLGVDMDLSHLSSKIRAIDKDRRGLFVVCSNVDSSVAPKGKSVVTFYLDASYEETPQQSTPEYERFKKKKLEEGIKKIEKVIPGISKNIVFKEILTPRSFERFTSMPKGAIYAFDQSISNKRPYFKTPLKGLYLSSSSTGLGCGVEAVILAGLKCAGDILEV